MGISTGPRVVLTILAVLASLAGLIRIWGLAKQGPGIDFYQFWLVGQAVDESLVEDVYDPSSRAELARIFLSRSRQGSSTAEQAAALFRRDEVQVSNSPFLYSLFRVIQAGDYDRDIALFRGLCLGAMLLSLAALGWRLGHPAWLIGALIAFVLWAYDPLVDDLREGNVNLIQMAGLSLFILSCTGRRRLWLEMAGAAALGAVIVFKPNIVFAGVAVVVLWAVTGRIRRLIEGGVAMGVGAAAGVLLSIPLFGSIRPWLDWVESLRVLAAEFRSEVSWGNFAGGWILGEQLGVSVTPVLYLAMFAVVAWIAWIGRWTREAVVKTGGPSGEPGGDGAQEGTIVEVRNERLVAAMGPLIPLIAGDLAWPHYLLMALPLVALLMKPALRGGWPAVLLGVSLLLISSRPFLPAVGLAGDYAVAGVLLAGSILIFSAGALEAVRAPAGPAASS